MENADQRITNEDGLSVIYPCFNEEGNIYRIPRELVPELDKLGMEYEILLIDDGSSDNTAAFAEGLNLPRLKIIKHEQNKGVGEAMKSGFRNARYNLILTMDADFSFRAELIPLLVNRYKQGDVDVVTGSPKLANHHEELTFFRWFVSKAARLVYMALFGKPVTSVNQMFRLYGAEDVKNLQIDARGFDVFAEILFKLMVLKNKRSAEVPAPMVVREHGVSKLVYRLEMLRHLKLIMKILKWQLQRLFRINNAA
jgi:glycosyltransferase involved in cell wall biosynthesis